MVAPQETIRLAKKMLAGQRDERVDISARLLAALINLASAWIDTNENSRAALRMIREAVETHAPPGSVPAEEYVEPPFTAEAEVLVKGIAAIAMGREPVRK